MSAILGIWHRDGRPVESQPLHAMMEPIQYLGRERSATWLSGPVAFGHHHLAYTPESVNERLPYTHPSGRWTIVADARLDNRQELLSALGRPVSDALSDSEIILLAYLQWDEQCVQHLLGDFAFVIWDAQKQRLVCVRDHMGVRPFFYHLQHDQFVFASGIKGVLAHPHVPTTLDEGRIAELLTPYLNDAEATCYTSIRRLPPAHIMVVTPDAIVLRRYWALDDVTEASPGSDEDYARELKRLFTQAVSTRARSAYPVGATLSGGLDSSSIVVTARSLAGTHFPGQLHTFSAAFPGNPYDESEYFNAVIEQGGVVPHVLDCNGIRPLQHLTQSLSLQGEMFHGLNLCIQIELYDRVKENGVRALMEGFDGDMTLCHGIDRLGELAQQGKWFTAAQECRALARRWQYPAASFYLRHLVKPAIPAPIRSFLSPSQAKTPTWDPIVNQAFARRIRLRERLAARRAAKSSHINVRQRHALRLQSGWFQNVFEILYPTALWRGFYPLYPYCDIKLMQFCVSLPSNQKLRHGLTRFIMHSAMDTLPETVRWRATKTDPTPIVLEGMHQWHQDTLAQEALAPAPSVGEYLDLTYARQAYHRYLKTPNSSDAFSLWKLIMTSQWMRSISTSNTEYQQSSALDGTFSPQFKENIS